MARVERYGPGEGAIDFDPGDFILTHRHNLIAGLISFGQKRRFRGADAAYAHWSHCALMIARDWGTRRGREHRRKTQPDLEI